MRRSGSARAAAARGGLAWAVAVGVPVAFGLVSFAWPLAAVLGRGLGDARAVAVVLGAERTWQLVGNTLAQASAGTAVALVLGLPAAHLLFRRRFRGRAAARALVTIPFVLPTVVVAIAFQVLFAPTGALGWLGATETFAAVVAALVFFNFAVVVRTVGGMWERLDPRATQAARCLGASPLRALATVTLPALAPALASAAAVVFLFCATAFGVVLVLGGPRYGTLETEIYTRATAFLDLRTAGVLSALQLAVVALALAGAALARRRWERGLQLTGQEPPPRLSWHARADRAVVTVVAVTVAVLIVAPLAHLVVRSFSDGGGWTLANYRALATTGSRSALPVTGWAALGQSLRTAAAAALLAMGIGMLSAGALSRRPRRLAARRLLTLADALAMSPLGVSAVVVGFGLLITLDRPLAGVDLRTSGLLIPIAQAVVAVPLVIRTVLPVVRAIDPRQRAAAATLGAGPARVLATIDLPLAARALGIALGFAFAVSLGEFGATAFLARPDAPTLPVAIVRLLGRPGGGNYGMALAAAVVLALVTASVMVVAEYARAPRCRARP